MACIREPGLAQHRVKRGCSGGGPGFVVVVVAGYGGQNPSMVESPSYCGDDGARSASPCALRHHPHHHQNHMFRPPRSPTNTPQPSLTLHHRLGVGCREGVDAAVEGLRDAVPGVHLGLPAQQQHAAVGAVATHHTVACACAMRCISSTQATVKSDRVTPTAYTASSGCWAKAFWQLPIARYASRVRGCG